MAVTITSTSALLEGYGGPFLSSGGNVYVVVREGATPALKVFKATDPTSSFSSVATIVTESVTQWYCVADGDTFHILWRTGTAYKHDIFDMSDDTLAGNNTIVTQDASSNSFIVGALRSDGDLIALHGGNTEKVMGVDYQRVVYSRREGGSWTTNIAVSQTGIEDEDYPISIAVGASDRMHLFYGTSISFMHHRSLSSANSLGTEFTGSVTTSTGVVSDSHNHRADSVDVSGTVKVKSFYSVTSATNDIRMLSFDSADAPTITESEPSNIESDNIGFTVSADESNNQIHLIYTDKNDQTLIFRNVMDSDNSTGTAVQIYDGAISTTEINSSIYTRSGVLRLGVLFQDGSVRYEEITLGQLVAANLIASNLTLFQPALTLGQFVNATQIAANTQVFIPAATGGVAGGGARAQVIIIA